MNKVLLTEIRSVHFIGIGGVGMSGLAKYSLTLGLSVSGSDIKDFSERKKMENLGIKVYIGHGDIRPVDLVVYTSAIPEDNVELLYAKSHYRTMSRCEYLESIRKNYKHSVGISGSHGKTTCTSMITGILENGNVSPVSFIGGEDLRYSNFKSGNGDTVVFEACEYRKNFLELHPDTVVILNIDDDHLDSYGSLENEINAFREYKKGKTSIINADDINSSKIIEQGDLTFGVKTNAKYTAQKIRKIKDGYSFWFCKDNEKIFTVKMKVGGRFNIYNALASCVVGDLFGIDKEQIKKGIEEFRGVKRRNEILLDKNVKIVADYAHHPKEIKTFLKDKNKNRITVFQPHTYSRTRILLCDFVSALKNEKNVIIVNTFPAREKYDYYGSAKRLTEVIEKESKGNVLYADGYKEMKEQIINVINEEKIREIYFLGAGDVYEYAKRLSKEIEK